MRAMDFVLYWVSSFDDGALNTFRKFEQSIKTIKSYEFEGNKAYIAFRKSNREVRKSLFKRVSKLKVDGFETKLLYEARSSGLIGLFNKDYENYAAHRLVNKGLMKEVPSISTPFSGTKTYYALTDKGWKV